MNEATFSLSVRNSKAIASADICLDQMTVLTGVNASGKSTIARMWSQLVNLSNLYPLFAKQDAWDLLSTWSIHIVKLKERINGMLGGVLLGGPAAEQGTDFSSLLSGEELLVVVNKLKEFTDNVLGTLKSIPDVDDVQRAVMAFVRAVGVGEELASDVEKLREVFSERVEKCIQRYQANMSTRNYYVYNQCKHYGIDVRWLTDVESMVFKEGDAVVYSVRKSTSAQPAQLEATASLREIFGIRDALYIASPWISIPRIKSNGVLRMSMDETPHIVVNPGFAPETTLFQLLGGELEIDEQSQDRRWIYRRRDGLTVGLEDCATGLKALSILDILYSRGYLNSETLLIIDEPEAHLHPQWIVEFARILVVIAKKLKVRMLLTSHNPDMIAALQKISKVEGLDGVRFYMAKPVGGSNGYKYTYDDLGQEIEPIFDMFNIAMDRIYAYGNG